EVCKGGIVTGWRKITDNVLSKAETNGTLALYYVDRKGKYMCINCYNGIVVNGSDIFKNHALEWERGLKKHRKNGNLSISESITLIANFIFQRNIVEGNQPFVEFLQLRYIIKEKDKQLILFFDEIEAGANVEKKSDDEKKELNQSLAYQLEGEKFTWVDGVEIENKDHWLSIFFNSIYNTTNPVERSDEYLKKLDKRLAFECYLICGTSHKAIDVFVNAGITITSRHMDRKKADIAELHDDQVDKILFDTRLEALSLHSYDDRIKAREEERKMKDSNIKKAIETFKEVFVTKQNDVNSNKDRVQLNISSLITRLTKQDIKDLVEGDQESKGQKKTKDTDIKNLSSEDDILTQLEKDRS
ncbi:35410_t:CDS:2, partial [Racocetra persica]